MCDTITAFRTPSHSFFAKNSDRDPAEFQFVYISNNPKEEFYKEPFQTEKIGYINNSFQVLKKIFNQYDHPYSAILSKPDWIWGAEMGVNEYGLAIGNEAVFSRERTPKDGLLGMDILRLALHNCHDANEAVDFITDLIERFSQGGNGSFSGKLFYHNSFMIKDFNVAYVVETSSRKWVKKKVNTVGTISNTYTIRDEYQKSNCNDSPKDNFKDKYENSLMTYFSKGNKRQQLSYTYLQQNDLNLKNIIKLMRLHKNDSPKMKRGMTSICMHPGFLIKSETTSSMIIEYYQDRFIVWFTGSPNPCISLYKPLVFIGSQDKNFFKDLSLAYKYSSKWRQYSKKIISNYNLFKEEIKHNRDKAESDIINKMQGVLDGEVNNAISLWEDSLQLAEDYLYDGIRKLMNITNIFCL